MAVDVPPMVTAELLLQKSAEEGWASVARSLQGIHGYISTFLRQNFIISLANYFFAAVLYSHMYFIGVLYKFC